MSDENSLLLLAAAASLSAVVVAAIALASDESSDSGDSEEGDPLEFTKDMPRIESTEEVAKPLKEEVLAVDDDDDSARESYGDFQSDEDDEEGVKLEDPDGDRPNQEEQGRQQQQHQHLYIRSPSPSEDELEERRQRLELKRKLPIKSPTPSASEDEEWTEEEDSSLPTEIVDKLPKRYKRVLRSPHKRNVDVEKYKSREPIFSIAEHLVSLGLDKEAFDSLLGILRPLIQRKDTTMREAIQVEERLACSLRFLMGGENFCEISKYTKLSPAYLARSMPEVCKAIMDTLEEEFLKLPSTHDEWIQISEAFSSNWQFPFCLGALCAKHIPIQVLKVEAPQFRNSLGSPSVVLFAVVDAEGRFVFVDTNNPGSLSDDDILRKTALWDMLNDSKEYFPEPSLDPASGKCLPYVFVAPNSFPLIENIITPYMDLDVHQEWQRVYNDRISLAIQTAESAYEIFQRRFRILRRIIKSRSDRIPTILRCCCILHNFFMARYPEWYKNYSATTMNLAGGDELHFMDLLEVAEPITGQCITPRGEEVRREYALTFFN